MKDPARRRVLELSLLAGLTAFVAVAISLSSHRQLGYLRGLSDRWFALGLNLSARAVFGEGDERTVFKPPGYPLLIAAAVRTVLGPPPEAEPGSFPGDSSLVGLTLPYPLDYIEGA